MILWARARQIPLLILTLITLALVLRLGRGQAVMAPTVLGGGSAAMTWSTLVLLLWAAALCACFDSAGGAVEHRPLRRLSRLDASLYAGGMAAFAVATVLTDDSTAWAPVLAHTAALGGLATAVTVLRDAGAGAMAATATVLVTSSISPHLAVGPYVRFLQPEGDTGFAVFVGLVLSGIAVGALTGQLRSPR
jgi:hypothetical protein